MTKFRVSRFLKRDLVVRVNSLDNTNIVKSKRKLFEFNPDGSDEGWYETTDEVLVDSIKNLTETLPFSKQAEEGLKQAGVDYVYSYCKSCGNSRVKKLEYHLFEVIQ